MAFVFPTSLSSSVSLQGPNARRLYSDLMRNYYSMVRPVVNDSDSISVDFGVTLRQIMDVVCKPLTLHTFLPSDCDVQASEFEAF